MGCCCSSPGFEVFEYDSYLLKKPNGQRSIEVESKDEKKGLGKIRRNPLSADALTTGITYDDKVVVRTIWEGMDKSSRDYKSNNCFGTRRFAKDGGKRAEYVWLTYEESAAEARNFGAGLVKLGLQPGNTVGLCSINRVEWSLGALGAYSQSMVAVALYDTLGADAIKYIVNHAETSVCCVSKDKLSQLLTVLPECKCVKTIVQFDEKNPKYSNPAESIDQKDVAKAAEVGVKLIGFSDVIALGRDSGLFPQPPKPDTLAFIMYTSGTTGVPKGAMLSHGNVCSCVGATGPNIPIRSTDRHISYLPLAHIFETVVQLALTARGGGIGFYQGNIKYIGDDIQTLQPTVMAGVPRVFSRMYERVLAGVNATNCIRRTVFHKAMADQAYACRRGLPLQAKWDRRIFSKVRVLLGLNQCRLIITGAAPMPAYLMEFLRVVVNPKDGILQGYGMTETAAAICISEIDDETMGHCGPPLPCAELRLREVPEMGYSPEHNPPTGEVLARGPSIFLGYFKNDQNTAETLQDGWIATGDIGRWNPTGTLSIIDRKKNIFKIAAGEYVAAEAIEGVFLRAHLIAQIWIYGNSYKNGIVAIVVPHAQRLAAVAEASGWWKGATSLTVGSQQFRDEFAKLVHERNSDVHDLIMTQIKAEAGKAKLKAYETPVEIYLEGEIDEDSAGFNQKNDTMTPTFKIKRPQMLGRYKERIIELYKKVNEPPKEGEKW